jgi:hypothetical protein
MKELFVMLAKTMSKESCFKQVEESVQEYREALLLGSDMEKVEHSLNMAMHLYILNQTEGSAEDVIKDMDQTEKSVNFFKTSSN